MSTRTRLATAAVAAVALAAIPSVASAAAPQLRGVVSGSPYGASGGTMAIPVLFSKMTLRNTGLKSPVGVIILKRTQKVALPGGGTSLPVNLRTGDRFKGSGTISDINKRTFYPRVPMNKDAVVYFRSKEMSLAELTAAVDALRKALAALQGQVNDLAKYTFAGFQQLLGEIDALKKQLASLSIPGAVDLSGLQNQINDLKTQLNGVIESLKDYAKLTDVDKKIADAIAGLSLLTNTDVTNTVTNILDNLSFDTTQLATFVGDTVNDLLTNPGALTDTVNGLIDDKISALDLAGTYATLTQLAAANQTISDLGDRLDTVCSALNAATVTIDPDGGGVLPAVQAPVALPGIGTACP
jgi:hypothetical protein